MSDATNGQVSNAEAIISVVVPTVRPTTIGAAVQSIVDQSIDSWELVVVGQGDHDSLEAAVTAIADGDPRIRYLALDQRGVSRARTAGMYATTGDLIAFMDDDCVAAPDWLEVARRSMTDDVAFIAGSLLAPPPEKRWLAVCPTIEPSDVIVTAESIAAPDSGFGLLGANMIVRRSDAERVGGFDASMGPGQWFAGGEEHDFLDRLLRTGAQARSTPKCVVNHTHGYRYGLKAVYTHRRDRVRGDGAVAGKGTMVEASPGEPNVMGSMKRFAAHQLRTVRPLRLPIATLRLMFYLGAYRRCLVKYRLDQHDDLVKAVLVLKDGPSSSSTSH